MPATSSTATRARSCRNGCRLQAEGKLTGPAALWMRTRRPAEELYDTKADPHQIANLSAEPAHRAALERMRRAVTDRMARIGDQGLINEPEMIQRMWPGGVQPETAQPYIVPRRTSESPTAVGVAHDQLADGDRDLRSHPGRVDRLHHGRGSQRKWRLYTGPILVDRPVTLRAKAIRYGYKESAETRVEIRTQ